MYFFPPMRLRHLSSLVLALLPAFASLAASAQMPAPAPTIVPEGEVWASDAGFDFGLNKKKEKKTRRSVSGMACNLDARQQHICLLSFDEGAQARYATLGPQALKPDDEELVLRTAKGELDAEAAATDGHYFYVTGSHSARRSDCASNPDSRHVIRLRLDPATGRALRTASGTLADLADSTRLWAIMQAQPGLAAYVGEQKCLGSDPVPGARKKDPSQPGQQGVNIEGLAVHGGRLYFGFRGPVAAGMAKVLSVDAEALFKGGDTRPELVSLPLGPQSGIRDMIAVNKGFLLLVGPDDSPSSQKAPFGIWHWDGKSAHAKNIAQLDTSQVRLRKCDKELKPEALTVLEETPQAYRLLVLSDGMCDGGALAFTLAR